jgi:hypothetical protein
LLGQRLNLDGRISSQKAKKSVSEILAKMVKIMSLDKMRNYKRRRRVGFSIRISLF